MNHEVGLGRMLTEIDMRGSEGHRLVAGAALMSEPCRMKAAAGLLDYLGDSETATIFMQDQATLDLLAKLTAEEDE